MQGCLCSDRVSLTESHVWGRVEQTSKAGSPATCISRRMKWVVGVRKRDNEWEGVWELRSVSQKRSMGLPAQGVQTRRRSEQKWEAGSWSHRMGEGRKRGQQRLTARGGAGLFTAVLGACLLCK